MSDERLRALQRRAEQTGDPLDAAAVLSERLRAGLLTMERLELAAYCGDEIAQEVIDPGLRFATPDGRALEGAYDFGAWVRNLSRWGTPVLLRAAWAAGWSAHLVVSQGNLPARKTLDAVRAWLDCPCDACLRTVRHITAGENCNATPDYAFLLGLAVAGDQANGHPERRAAEAIRGCRGHGSAAEEVGETRIRQAIRSALISYALGTP